MRSKTQTIVVGGQARLPKEFSAGELFQVVVELEPESGQVLEVSFSSCLSVIEKMLREMIVGMNMETDVNELLETIESRLHHKSKKAVIMSIKDLLREYKEYQYRASKRRDRRLS